MITSQETLERRSTITLGLDVSTANTGIALLEGSVDGSHPKILLLTHVELSKVDGFWLKVDALRRTLFDCKIDIIRATHVFVEESLQAFRPGLSSANTLMTLAKFNGVVSSVVRDLTGLTPTPIAATSARKMCGISVKKGSPAKKQVFDRLVGVGGALAHVEFPTKRGGAPKDWAYDEVDAYVIARAGLRTLSL